MNNENDENDEVFILILESLRRKWGWREYW